MEINSKTIQSFFFLVCIYLIPYRLAGPLALAFGVLIFILSILIWPSNSYINKNAKPILIGYLFLNIFQIASGFVNHIGFYDVLFSVIFYSVPAVVIMLLQHYTAEDWKTMIRLNSWFVFLQIPFLILQHHYSDLSTDDWFQGSMSEWQNTQIVAFVFFINAWLYLDLFLREKKYLITALLSLLCAFATNTMMQTGVFLFVVLIYLLRNISLKRLIYALIATPVLAYIIYVLVIETTVAGFESFDNIMEKVSMGTAGLLEIGKIRGIVFAFEHMVESASKFFLGHGPGIAASRMVIYKTEWTTTETNLFDPLTPLYYDFTAGTSLRSNLLRPWSNISAIFLEGGMLFAAAFYYILRKFYKCFPSPESRAIFTFTFLCMFIEHVMDNMKMSFFFAIVSMYFLFLKTNNESGAGLSGKH